MPVLKIQPVGGALTYFDLALERVTLGRDTAASIRLDSPEVSATHAIIDPTPEGFRFTDARSTNGSRLNGYLCDTAILQEGDVLTLGDVQITFLEEGRGPAFYAGSERTMAFQTYGDTAQRKTLSESKLPGRQSVWSGLLPGLQWLKSYRTEDARFDVLAGFTIAALLVPQGMAFALLAGMPPVTGLYASILPLCLYALTGTSRHLSVAPVSLDSLLVGSGIGMMAVSGTQEYLQLVVMLTLLVGVLQWLMGILRMGFVVNFLSRPVLTGFTLAAAITIAVSQLDKLLGLHVARSSSFWESFSATLQQLWEFHPLTAVVGVGSVVFLQLWRRLPLPIPGPIMLLFVSTIVAWQLGLGEQGVVIVGEVPSGLPHLALWLPDAGQAMSLLPLALTLTYVGFMEALSIGKRYASESGYRIYPNAEFRALGMANLGASLSGGFVVSGSLSRTAVAVRAGARSQAASLVAASLVLLAVTLLTPLFHHVPIPALAAIIITSVLGLINIAEIRYLLRVKPLEISVLVVTLFGTLAWGFTYGLLAGVLAALIVHIVIQTKPNTSALGRLPGTSIYRSLKHHPEAQTLPGVEILRIDASFYFANAEYLRETLASIIEQPTPPRTIILDASAINDLDSSGDSAFREIFHDLSRQGISLYIAGLKTPVRAVLQNSGLYTEIGPKQFFYTVAAAVQRYTSESEVLDAGRSKEAVQD